MPMKIKDKLTRTQRRLDKMPGRNGKHKNGSREHIKVSLWMNQLREATGGSDPGRKKLPEAEALWQEALSRQQISQHQSRRILKPLYAGQIAGFLFGITVFIFFLCIFRAGPNQIIRSLAGTRIASELAQGIEIFMVMNSLVIPVMIILFVYFIISELKGSGKAA